MSIEAIQNSTPTDFNALDAALNQQSSFDSNRFAQDNALLVQFYTRPLRDEEASKEAGRAIYRDTEFVKIIAPGDKTSVIDRPVKVIEDETIRFAKQYEAFKRGATEQVSGTPIGLMPGISESQVEEYKHLGIRTIEHLAAAPDSVTLRVMGMVELKQRAQKMLAVLEGKAEAERDAERDERLSKLEQQNRELMEQLNRVTAPAAASEQPKVSGTPLGKGKG